MALAPDGRVVLVSPFTPDFRPGLSYYAPSELVLESCILFGFLAAMGDSDGPMKNTRTVPCFKSDTWSDIVCPRFAPRFWAITWGLPSARGRRTPSAIAGEYLVPPLPDKGSVPEANHSSIAQCVAPVRGVTHIRNSHPGLPSGAIVFRSIGAGVGRRHSALLACSDGPIQTGEHTQVSKARLGAPGTFLLQLIECWRFAGEGARATRSFTTQNIKAPRADARGFWGRASGASLSS